MTILDEPALRQALCDAAEAVPVPDRVADVLAAARALERGGSPTEPMRRLWERAFHRARGPVVEGLSSARTRPRRVMVAAASAIVLAGAVAAMATLGGSSDSARSSNTSGASPGSSAHGPAVDQIPKRAGPGATAFGVVPTTLPAAPGATSAPATAHTGGVPSLPTGSVGQSSKVEESGSVDLSVGRGRLDDVVARLGAVAAANGGFVADSQAQSAGSANGAYGTVTLQVPQGSFASVVAEVQALGTVTSLTTKGTDVTGQYVDLQSRIAALQASRDQYLTIMTKASSISDILAVQNQLDDLQSQIEQLQGQLQVLDNETTYGTLAVSIAEPGHHPTPSPAPPSGIRSAWHDAVSGFTAAFDGLVRVAGPLLFVVFLLLAVGIGGRIAWRTVRRQAL